MANAHQTNAAPESIDDPTALDVRLHAEQQRAFRIHTRVFAASMVVIFLVNLALNAAAGIMGEWWAWWSALALIGWGLGVTVHGVVVRIARTQSLGSA